MKRLLVVPLAVLGALVLPSTALADGIAVSPQTAGTFDYGTVEIGHRQIQSFTATNLLPHKTQPLRIRLTGSTTFKKTWTSCRLKRLAPGKTCVINVSYTPATDGQTTTASLEVTNQGLNIDYSTIALSGTAHGTADLVWTPSNTYDFGSTPGTHAMTITNVGTATATIAAGTVEFLSGITPDKFCVLSNLAPGASCTENWTFETTSDSCPSPGWMDSGGSTFVYYVDSTLTTTAQVTANLTATCP